MGHETKHLSIGCCTCVRGRGRLRRNSNREDGEIYGATDREVRRGTRGSVSGVVGYSVPAPVGMDFHEQATNKNYNVSSVTLSCTFGLETTVASQKKAVIISEETLSRSLSKADMQKLLALQQKSEQKSAEKIKVVPYSGLGGTAYYMTFSDATIHVESIFTASGKKSYGATVDSNLSKSKLANLVKLAEKL